MAVSGMQWGWHWARWFDGTHSHSVTVQVNNRDIVADTGLVQKWAGGSRHHSGTAQIVQVVSNSGVENFPTGNLNHLNPTTLFRVNATSITFHVRVYKAHAMARWMLYFWV